MQPPNKVRSRPFALVPPSHRLAPVRKAYKKRALQTHPDRAPASDKAQAEERFRQVRTVSVLCDWP